MRRNRLAMAIAEEVAALERPRFLRIVANLLIHDRREEAPDTGERCICCGSGDAVIVERRLIADLVIDTMTGERITAKTHPVTWEQYCEIAERHDVPFRCAASAVEMLLDETGRHLFASGGHRAMKTTTGLVWIGIQILRHGGAFRRFWLVASTGEKAFRLLEKLFRPTPSPSGGVVDPILPAVLVARAPDSHRASDQLTRLVDGSLIDLRGFKGDPGAERAKSDNIVAGLVDEAAHLPSGAWMSALEGRCLDLRGRLWLASTATPSSHLNPLVEKILEWQRMPADSPERTSGEHEGAAWVFRPFPLLNNPWLNLESLQVKLRTVDMTKPENRRDYGGEWCASEGLCWTNFIAEPENPPIGVTRCHLISHEARKVGDLSPRILTHHRADKHVDITPRVARGLFSKANPHHKMARASKYTFIIGQDVNLNPMSSALLQVTAPEGDLDNRDRWHYWILDTVSTETSNALAHAERLVSPTLSMALDHGGSGSPLKGCGVIMDATSISRDPTAKAHGQSGSIVETFWRSGLDVRAPLYVRTTPDKPGHRNGPITDRFRLIRRIVDEGRLHVFSRCGDLLNAFATQLATPDGVVPLDARRGKWDRIMGPMDAATYAILAAANVKAPTILRDWASLPAG